MRNDVLENERIAMELFRKGTAPPFSFVYGGRPSSEIEWDWKLEGDYVDLSKWQRTLHLTDPETHLRAAATCTIYADTPGFEWTLGFMNIGPDDSLLLEAVKTLDITMASGGPIILHRLRGSSCRMDDWLPYETTLDRGTAVEFRPTGGRSSNGACPFYNVQWPGGGVITAVGWSGQWTASVEYTESGKLRLRAGMECLRTVLHSGEMISGPRILQVWWGGELEDSYNLFRRLMFAHILPRGSDGEVVIPPVADLCTSAKIDNAPNERMVYPHVEALRGRGIEVYWIDAYQTRGGFPDGIGNYDLNNVGGMTSPRRFPNGLKPISDAIHEGGMDFLLWQEPERVAPGTFLDLTRPEWVLRLDGQRSGLFNLGNPDAREYMTAYLVKVVEQIGLQWLRIDCNIDPLPFWLAEDDPDRIGMTEMHYVDGFYQMLDEIRVRCPWLKIDNCASGGRRIDLETCSRMTPLWRSDLPGSLFVQNKYLQAAMQNQAMTAGLSRYVPFSMSGGAAHTPYLFRSSFNGGIPLMEECRLPDYPLESVDLGIAEAKRLRPYLLGDMYVLSDVTVDPTKWSVVQYHRPEEDDGFVMAFRRHESPYATFECEMRGINLRAEYLVYVEQLAPPFELTGERLARWRICIEEAPGSLLIEYRRPKAN